MSVPRLSRQGLFKVAAHLCNLNDGLGDGQKSIIYTPVLPSVFVRDRPRFDVWMRKLVAEGATHALFNVPDGDPSYGGVWDQPNLWQDLHTYRQFLDTVLATRGATGFGLCPMIWLDHGGKKPLPRIRERWPRFDAATRDIQKNMIGFVACEPVVGDWSSYEASEALELLRPTMPEIVIGWHTSPDRWVGSSNPVEADDPWQGAEAEFYKSHGGEHIQIVGYQTRHGRSLYTPCGFDTQDDFDHDRCTCWLSRAADGIRRNGTGFHGWRIVPTCLLETTTFEHIRGQATSADARAVATEGKKIADRYGVTIGYGNGLPN